MSQKQTNYKNYASSMLEGANIFIKESRIFIKDLPRYSLGTVLKRLDMGGTYFHYGIVTGHNMVTHNSKECGRVVEESLEVFANGEKVKICYDITSNDPQLAVTRAKRRIGESYNLLNFNCEDLVKYAHGINTSGQVESYAKMGAGAITLSAATNDNLGDFAIDAILYFGIGTLGKMAINALSD